MGNRRTNDCRGVVKRAAYGVYTYSERSDAGCIATTRIELRPDGTGGLRFSETYVIDDGGRGRVVGRLARRR